MYENYAQRREKWIEYFNLVSLGNPFDNRGNYHPEHYIAQYLLEDQPDMELMWTKLVNSKSLREKFLLELLIEEFDPSGAGLDIGDIALKDIKITNSKKPVKKG